MALPLYLAMTAAEISCTQALPARCAYMACHFSPYGTGLSNFPRSLPKGSILIVNDRTPVQRHDPELIAAQLTQLAEEWEVTGILLDFQRPGSHQTTQIARAILSAPPCPVGISECYAQDFSCPVFLSPPPLDRPLSEYIAPWQGRELWLEAALDAQIITVTPQESRAEPFFSPDSIQYPHQDPRLHCHYKIETGPSTARFTLQRTPDDLTVLLQEAETLGITQAVGLYQELGQAFV